MEQELREKIFPIVDVFVNKLLDLEKVLLTKETDLVKKIEGIKQQEENLKILKLENQRQLDLGKDKLAEERLRLSDLNSQIKDELARYNTAKKEFEQRTKNIEQNLKDSQVEKELVSSALCRAKKSEEEYKIKIDRLQEDFNKFDKIKIEFDERNKYLLAKEKNILKIENEQTIKSVRLNDIELKLKAREIEVVRLIKRYELEKFIGEK